MPGAGHAFLNRSDFAFVPPIPHVTVSWNAPAHAVCRKRLIFGTKTCLQPIPVVINGVGRFQSLIGHPCQQSRQH